MGTYTCLKFTGQLKKEYAKEIKELFDWSKAKIDDDDFNEWKEFAKKHDFAKHFASLGGATSIPFGCFSAYNADKVTSFDDDHSTFSNVIYSDDGYESIYTWVFACDLKSYSGEIDTFLSEIAPNICNKFIAEKWGEDWGFPLVYYYGLKQGESVELKDIRVLFDEEE